MRMVIYTLLYCFMHALAYDLDLVEVNSITFATGWIIGALFMHFLEPTPKVNSNSSDR